MGAGGDEGQVLRRSTREGGGLGVHKAKNSIIKSATDRASVARLSFDAQCKRLFHDWRMLLHRMVFRHSAVPLICGKPATHTAELLGLANHAMSMR